MIGVLMFGFTIFLGTVLYARYSNKEYSNRLEATISEEPIRTTVTSFTSTSTQPEGGNLSVLPTLLATANTATAAQGNFPNVLYSDRVFLKVSSAMSGDPSSYLFDFDTNHFSSEDLTANDIRFVLTGRTNIFLVILPVNGATGEDNDKGTLDGNINFQDCLDLLKEYSKAGRPIPAKGTHYCWRTNQGRIVGLSVEGISEKDGLYQIEIEYTVWNTKIN